MKLLFVPIMALSLSACIKAPTIEERLAGKAGSAREQELYQICKERSRYAVPGGHESAYIGHESRMRIICDEMHETNVTEENHAAR